VTIPPGDPSGVDVFALWLVCGLLPWNFVSNALVGGMGSLVGNANLIKKVYFPREILVFSTVLSLMITFLVEMGVLLLALLIFGNFVIPWIPVLLLLMALEAIFVLGIGLILSTLNVYFRDIQHLVNVAMTALFYSMPIVYPISFVTQRKETVLGLHIVDIYRLNPLVRMVQAFRAVLYDLKWPAFADVAYFAAWAFGLCALGFYMFRKFERRLAEEL
jgi:ABC-2 type transport system permease protein